ncbi:MAG: hypothetical protein N2381_05235 [Armatimonadetes bacterium]|nr:hypothetical protein [Armatimonadota bacterium]
MKGLPSGRFGWILREWKGQLFLVYLTGKRDVVELLSKAFPPGQTPFVSPFPVVRIDPDAEHVIEEFTSKHHHPVPISAEREQRPDSWLAQDYDYWVLDEQANIAYALKPTRWDEWDSEKRYAGVYVIDLKTRWVKNFLEISPVFTLALHPNRQKLYVMTAPEKAEVEAGEVQVYSTANLGLLKTITYNGGVYIWDTEFSQDGSRLFCCVDGRGLLVVDTVKDQFELWEEPADMPVNFGFPTDFSGSIALASDEKEVYVALRDGWEKGRVAAIDIAQKKLVRTLELSQTACTSVVVMGDKLFAACLDGVYVIDIPAWRQKQ